MKLRYQYEKRGRSKELVLITAKDLDNKGKMIDIGQVEVSEGMSSFYSMMIGDLEVKKAYRGRGYGAALVRAALRYAKKTKQNVDLEACPSKESGRSVKSLVAWYIDIGFSESAEKIDDGAIMVWEYERDTIFPPSFETVSK